MPFVKIGSKLIYFAHVPKCGGTTIESAIRSAGHNLNFYDKSWWSEERKWSRSSPQHITTKDLTRIIDIDIFDYTFTVIRDPVDRFISAFNHNRLDRRIAWYESLPKFLNKLEKSGDYFLYRFDNHFLPASYFIPEKCEIFYLEDGMEPIRARLSNITGGTLNSSEYERKNVRQYNNTKSKNIIKSFIKNNFQPIIPKKSELNQEIELRIREAYKVDYDLFYATRYLSEK
ncbi:sulfotransferase family 2 domain-containing protein [Amorphus sp. 3PC139-8]|uniref:sulfotransferase family 2 domain-containing protein n=1 Tax=Amorphus sp. 3PC139-8 TaxID=2735676 RepID=UPI00345D476D